MYLLRGAIFFNSWYSFWKYTGSYVFSHNFYWMYKLHWYIYNMIICLLIVVKVMEVKVISCMECVPFIDFLYRRRGGILLQLPQMNIFVFRGGISTWVGTDPISDVKWMCGNENSPESEDFDVDTVHIFFWECAATLGMQDILVSATVDTREIMPFSAADALSVCGHCMADLATFQ